jgi:hypothetical protein
MPVEALGRARSLSRESGSGGDDYVVEPFT